MKFICRLLESNGIRFRDRLVDAVNRATQGRLKQQAELERLEREGPREIFELAWVAIQAVGRGFHPCHDNSESLLARILILDFPAVRPSVLVVQTYREFPDGRKEPGACYWMLKAPELPEAEKVKVFEKWLAAVRGKQFLPLPGSLVKELQQQKYETPAEKARREKEDEIRAAIGQEPPDPELEKLLQKLRESAGKQGDAG